jgi:hypothetical protein
MFLGFGVVMLLWVALIRFESDFGFENSLELYMLYMLGKGAW